ncbi:protein ALP1-like isoform X1 [Prosopis cineraria]|uniref:protein ALP1-like isoform X1 n=2 Tax=Prosopis cineraria TaxID=364024 RepID=UPI00240F5ED1|nr:protein ALP1-like isoform X1 [Prosopis cineraria]XP_054796963.1 protein ALP1-like isoform X1 [Prosopis cineraria]XP_054801237.1 protein ALP1-like isoform X1 [Prosopis cineraria]XP_054809035.1 protein ALP1-like isoform X1 [Prosopis cineraria]
MALSEEKRILLRLFLFWMSMTEAVYAFCICMCMTIILRRRRIRHIPYKMDFIAKRSYLKRMMSSSDVACYNLLRMHRSTFDKLCSMLTDVGGLKPSKNMLVDEQVAMFLHILAHHVKNRVIQHNFGRSGETISRHFNSVLTSMMRLGDMLLKKPEPVADDSSDERWKWFKNCLGALDGTHIKLRVPSLDKARYRNRKGEITTNVLGVCSQDGFFIYVLPGWEGSAADGRVLRDAISRRNGLRVPQGHYYLVDAGYTNCKGFLAPYRGQRYHLSEWREGRHPRSAQECFNMRHSSARNVIERCFGILKLRWAILRSASFYPIRTHNRVIIACCLLHNLIRQEGVDPLENEVPEMGVDMDGMENTPIQNMDASDEWATFRDTLANEMFTTFSSNRISR